MPRTAPLLLGLLFLAGCGPAAMQKAGAESGSDKKLELDVIGPWHDPEADLPHGAAHATADLSKAALNRDAPTIAIVHATILTATGRRIEDGTLVTKVGALAYVGEATDPPEGATVIDAKGRPVTPGLIDAHSHIGVYAVPDVAASADGNEMVSPVTAQVRAAYAYWPQDPAITRARAGGVTTALILPGSANLIGGRGVSVIMKPGRSIEDVRFPGAPPVLKMACGENPKRVYGDKGGPQTRMGVYAGFRAAYQQAAEYLAKERAYEEARKLWLKKRKRAAELEAKNPGKQVPPESAPEPPSRDLGNETLAAVLRGEVLVQVHCYRSDDLRQMVAIADDYGFKIRAFHHALEAYKVRDLLIKHGIAIATWADWWGFKMEAFDGIPENAALYTESGGRAAIHSDSAIGIQRLNQGAAKALAAGRAAGIDLSEDDALRWITANPAWELGIDEVTGTLEVGKRADVVIWSGDPLSVYSLPDLVIQGGEIAYRREKGLKPTDFELGNSAVDHGKVTPPREVTR